LQHQSIKEAANEKDQRTEDLEAKLKVLTEATERKVEEATG